jgi:hypothetical protein
MNTKNEIKSSGKPLPGQLITIRGTLCRIVKVLAFGTLEATSLDGLKSFRMTGLNFL